MRRKHGWLGMLLLLGLWVVPHGALAAEGALKFWLTLNEPVRPARAGDEQEALDAFFTMWAAREIDLSSMRDKARHDPAFARALLSQRVLLEELAAFRANQPAFPPIAVTFFTWEEYFARLKAAMQSTDRPHLFEVPSSWCASLATDVGLLAPLPQELSRQAEAHSLPQLLATCRLSQKGPLYALPWLVDVRLLFFWREVFPTLEAALQQGSQAPETFQQALRQAKTHWSPHRPLFALPTARDWDLLHQTALLIWGHGGELVQRTWWPVWRWHSAVFREEALLGALFVKRLVQENLATLPRVTRDALEQEFLAQQLGSLIAGPWLIPRLQARLGPAWDTHVGLALPPVSEGDAVTFLGGSLLGLSTAAHEPQRLQEAQTTLATYLTQGTSALTYGRAVGKLPASRHVLGTVEDAISARPALQGGMPPETYFQVLVSRTTGDAAPRLLEKTLHIGRTYPALSSWATKLEVPSVLTSLYHLWQDLAANETERGLRADVAVLVHEWNEALAWLPPGIFWLFVILALTCGGIMVGLSWYATVLAARGRGITQTQRVLVEAQIASATLHVQLQRLVGSLARGLQQRGDEEPRQADAAWLARLQEIAASLIGVQNTITIELSAVGDHIRTTREEIREALAKLPSLLRPQNGPRKKLEITLPRHEDGKLLLTLGDKTTELTGDAARLLDYLIRQSLCEGRRDFSLLLGFLLLWTDGTPQHPKDTWQQNIARIRKGFREVGWKETVLPWARGDVYHLRLREADYECCVPFRGDFRKEVWDRYQKARELWRQKETLAALDEALAAYEVQAGLHMQDIQVLTLLCRIRRDIDVTMLAPSQRAAIEAKEDLLDKVIRKLQKYQANYERFLSPHTLATIRTVLGIQPGRPLSDDIDEQWKTLQGRLQNIQDVLEPGLVEDGIPPPVADEWEDTKEALDEVRKMGSPMTFDTWWRDLEMGRVNAFTILYEKVLQVWGEELIELPLRAVQASLAPEPLVLNHFRDALAKEMGKILWEKLTETPMP